MVLQKPNFLRSHPSVTIKPTAPAPRFESSRCFLHGALRERNANCPHHLKVANPARLVPLPPIEGVRLAAGGAGAKSEILFARSPSGVQGVPPDTPLVTFVVKRKSPGVEGRSAPSWGVQRGSAPRISGHAGAPVPAKTSEGEAVPPLPIPRNEQKVASQRATPGRKKTKRESPLAFLPALCYTLFKHLSKH